MLARIITALIGIPIVVALVFWPGGLPFKILAGLAATIGLLEFYSAATKGGARPHLVLGLVGALLFLYFSDDLFSLQYIIPTFTGLILVSLTVELFRAHHRPLANVGATVLGLGYVVWLVLHFIWLRDIDGLMRVGPWTADRGAWLLMFVLLTTWALDSGAYFVGRFYGTRKLAPRISPGKTVEGSVGGFVSALIVGAVVAAIMDIPQPHGLILGALIGITGQIGDLAGSTIKREVGIKDFGAIMPGHGGVLDRLDSLLFAVPVVYWYLIAVLPHWVSG